MTMRFPAFLLGACALLLPITASAVGAPRSKLTITFLDVEGGQATLFVDSTGKSLLIDTGWDKPDGRDADRIVAAAHSLGVKKLDFVLITHFHDDHVGGVPALLARIPVGVFLDHGENREHTAKSDAMYAAYLKLIADKHLGHIVPKPGDTRAIGTMNMTTLSADATVLKDPLPGAGEPNTFCPAQAPENDVTENQRSLGSLITFGGLRILDLGDLTKDMEYKLMCPINRVGHIDILVVSHHGWYMSSSPALVNAITPRVAIMDNGEKKGGSTPTLDTFAKVDGLETLWQLHTSAEGGKSNTDLQHIANLLGEPDAAHSLVLNASSDGSFSVTNTRTGVTQNYPAKK